MNVVYILLLLPTFVSGFLNLNKFQNFIKQINTNQDKLSKNENFNFQDVVRKGFAFGLGTGSSIPFLDGIERIPDRYDAIQSKLDSAINYKDIIPSEFTLQLLITGNEWSYSKLMHSLNEKIISGISISQDGKFAIVIDNCDKITGDNLHVVTTIPLHVDQLIHKLLVNDINFDIITMNL